MKILSHYSADGKILILLALIIISFFYPVFIQGKMPIPSDTIVGMYHPYRDNVWNGFANGVPFKNFLITDPIRQQYLWRKSAIETIKKGALPVWNPYSFSGYPLLANFQSAVFYPLNIIYFFFEFNIAWTIQIILQPLVAGLFLYLFLRFIKVGKLSGFIFSFIYAFSGNMVAWLEWNTIGHIMALLPLSLLSIEKIHYFADNDKRNAVLWSIIFVLAICSSFFAGHLQLFFYSLILIVIFSLSKLIGSKINNKNYIILIVCCFLVSIILTFIQWYPTFKLISLSARSTDQAFQNSPGWFIPLQNLIQFITPDFFGNPATGNYFGVWNYGEFIGYVGIITLISFVYLLLYVKRTYKIFFLSFMGLSLLFALPNPIAKIPYLLKIPILSTSQPTRLIFITVFSICILGAFGLDQLLKEKNKKRLLICIIPLGLMFLFLWLWAYSFIINNRAIAVENLIVLKRNLIFPTVVFMLTAIALFGMVVKNNTGKKILPILLFGLIIFDQFRLGYKFLPFSNPDWLYPDTTITKYLKDNTGLFRIMSIDRRILPGNFSVAYGFQDVSGYDPLYLTSYSKLVSSWDRDKPDINAASFNRIITPVNFESFITDLLGVKFVLSMDELKSSKLRYVTSEGQTKLYENLRVFPRAFFVEKLVKVNSDQEVIKKMFELKSGLINSAIVTDDVNLENKNIEDGETVKINGYSQNLITLITESKYDRMLILTDQYYPFWSAYVDGKQVSIYKADLVFRGIVVPNGKHLIEFKAGMI